MDTTLFYHLSYSVYGQYTLVPFNKIKLLLSARYLLPVRLQQSQRSSYNHTILMRVQY